MHSEYAVCNTEIYGDAKLPMLKQANILLSQEAVKLLEEFCIDNKQCDATK
jgi:hypothetical protein